ncbi:MAG: helix-turn-helix transcriptional regulator, partial [Kiloniellales bacterium]
SSAGIAVMNPVRVFRRFRDLRQAALAEAAGIRQGYLSEIERGAKAPSLATARALARALEVDLELLLPAEA